MALYKACSLTNGPLKLEKYLGYISVDKYIIGETYSSEYPIQIADNAVTALAMGIHESNIIMNITPIGGATLTDSLIGAYSCNNFRVDSFMTASQLDTALGFSVSLVTPSTVPENNSLSAMGGATLEEKISSWHDAREISKTSYNNDGHTIEYSNIWQEIQCGIRYRWIQGLTSRNYAMLWNRLRKNFHADMEKDTIELYKARGNPNELLQSSVDARDAYLSYIYEITNSQIGWGGRLGVNPFASLVELWQSGRFPVYDGSTWLITRSGAIIGTVTL